MNRSTSGQLTTRRSILSLFGGWTVVMAVLMALAGHSWIESLGAGLIVASQFTAGFVFWQLVARGVMSDFVGSAAMGGVVGALLSAGCGIVLAGTPLVGIAWSIPVLVAAVLVRRVPSVGSPSATTLVWLLGASLIGLSTEWTWLFPSALATIVFAGRMMIRRWLVATSLAVLTAAQVWLVSVRSEYWSQFRQGLTEVGDYPYLEAIARGAARWAHTDNVLASGSRLGYHWLSFAWAGRVTETIGSTSMAFSSHVIHVSFVFISIALTYTVARRMGCDEKWSLFSTFAVAMLVGVPIGLFQALSVHSPSQPFVLAMVLGVFVLISSWHVLVPWRLVPLLALLLFGVVGGKVSAVPAVVAGVLVLLVGRRGLTRKGTSRAILMIAVSALVVALSFVYFYGGVVADGTTGSLRVSLFEVAYTEGPLSHVDRPFWLTIVGVVALLGGVVATAPGVLLLRRFPPGDDSRLTWMMVAGATASVLVGLVYVGERSGVSYFFNLAVALVVPVSASALSRVTQSWSTRSLLEVGVTSLVVGFVIPNAIIELDGDGVLPSVGRSFLLIVPLCVGAAVVFVGKTKSSATAALLVSGIAMASYLAWIPRYAGVQARNSSSYEVGADTISGSSGLREAAAWLRDNSAVDDVIATNRFCNRHDERLPDCEASWTVVSSVSGRRMYVENIDWGARSVGGVLDRALESVAFVDQPSDQTAEIMTTANVAWVLVDRSVTTRTSWEPWADVVFENEDAFVLRLLDEGIAP